jgi:hypothetical protein
MIPSSLLPSRIGGYGQRELASVVIPGTLLLIEFWLMIFSPEEVEKKGGYLQLASDQIKDANDWILAIALFLAALAAYTLGLLGRMSLWAVFHYLRCKQTPFIDLLGSERRFPTGPKVREKFIGQYGGQEVTRALAGHPALEHALGKEEHDPFFQYAKLWLRHCRPQLAVEYHEAEINFLVGILAPLLVAPFVVLRQAGLFPFFFALVAALLLGVILFSKALKRSRDETFDVMRNFLLAQWYATSETALRRPSPAAGTVDVG